MQLRDLTFQRVFANLFVYNVLYEDSEVDERFLGVDERSSVLAISGAGCRVAGHLSARPRRIDAVDINKHHLALTALKVEAARSVESYAQFYDLFGRGWAADPAAVVRPLVERLPRWMQSHWKRNHRVFRKTLYHRGVTSQLFSGLRRMAGVDGAWLAGVCRLPVEKRRRAIEDVLAPVMRSPHVSLVLKSPLQLIALGVNFTQRDKLCAAEGRGIVDVVIEHLKKVAETDLAKNWFAWQAVAGHYNHDVEDAVPPYLRRDRHERSLGARTKLHYHHRNIFDVLADARRGTWTHYTVCDAPDWMPEPAQKRLLDEVHRTSKDGAVLQIRSVERDDLIARLGEEKRFRRFAKASDAATGADRSRLYRRVDYYQVAH